MAETDVRVLEEGWNRPGASLGSHQGGSTGHLIFLCFVGGGVREPFTGEGFQNDENRVWGRFQNA